MEEAVTKKFVHEESSSITQLCGKYRDTQLLHLWNWENFEKKIAILWYLIIVCFELSQTVDQGVVYTLSS